MNSSPQTTPADLGLGHCRLCGEPLRHTFVNLGMSPLCESYVAAEALNQMEPFYPLHVLVCHKCFLVQIGEYVSADRIYSEYAYFSSYSDSWLRHAREYVDMITSRLGLGRHSLVIELASNDGYLLQNFVEKSIPVLGIDPAANIAPHALRKGVPTLVRFFGVETANELVAQDQQADLLIGNNVLAHVPALNDFVAGMKLLLKPGGAITMEFPHLWRLMEANQFDTIYHEHFSYLSFLSAEKAFARHGLTIFDVEELASHGGSLRIYGRHAEDTDKAVTARVTELRRREQEFGFERLSTYAAFGERVEETKRTLLDFLIRTRRAGQTVAGYGAPGKGNTLLNYCGIRTDFLDYTVDRNPYKQGKFLPGSRIPIYSPEKIAQTKPDYVLILPWNLKDEIVNQLSYIREWGGKFVTPIPTVEIIA